MEDAKDLILRLTMVYAQEKKISPVVLLKQWANEIREEQFKLMESISNDSNGEGKYSTNGVVFTPLDYARMIIMGVEHEEYMDILDEDGFTIKMLQKIDLGLTNCAFSGCKKLIFENDTVPTELDWCTSLCFENWKKEINN